MPLLPCRFFFFFFIAPLIDAAATSSRLLAMLLLFAADARPCAAVHCRCADALQRDYSAPRLTRCAACLSAARLRRFTLTLYDFHALMLTLAFVDARQRCRLMPPRHAMLLALFAMPLMPLRCFDADDAR